MKWNQWLQALVLASVLCFACTGQASADERAEAEAAALLAEQGDAVAQFRLGFRYANGIGVVKDYKAAVKWYQRSAEQGNALSQWILGAMYEQGGLRITQNYTVAEHWYRLSAEQGNFMAEERLGLMYELGLGVAVDYKEAVKWYQRSADQGNASAQHLLGRMYEQGYGVAQNFIWAYLWFDLATTNTVNRDLFKEAVEARDTVTKKMTSQQIALAQESTKECVVKHLKGCEPK
jgi:uncharacterized protein